MTYVRTLALACALSTLAFVPATAAASVPAAPKVSHVAVASGPVSGGQMITISGMHLVSVQAVRFGATDGRSVHVVGSRKLTVVAPPHALGVVHVRVVTSAGTSAKSTKDEFTYLPDPVSELAVPDRTGTSVLVTWLPASGTDSIVVRRVDGTTPPTANSGSKVATLAGDAKSFRDSGLVLNTKYAYAVFAKVGPARSQAATVATHTATADRPAAPSRLAVGPQTSDPTAGPCTQVPAWTGSLGGSDLVLGATIEDPDQPGTPIRAEFELRDVTDPAAPVDVVTADDESGWSAPSTDSPAVVGQWFAPSVLADGHSYQVDALTSDGSAHSRRSVACSFGYDAQAPSLPKVTLKESTVSVGDKAHFIFSSSDLQPATGSASGIDHFGYSSSSGTDGGTQVAATGSGLKRSATIVLIPTTWGTNYLYVQTVDAAGNESTVRRFQYYVSG